MQYISVRAIALRLSEQFGVEMDIFAIIRACRDALDKMGMMALSRFLYIADVVDYKVLLNSSIYKVRGVIRLDGNLEVNGTVIFSDRVLLMQPMIVFTEPDVTLTPEPILLQSNYVPQIKGPYVNHVWKNPIIQFNETDFPVAIECTGLMLDDEKFPMVPESAFFGCLYYALFVYYQPLFIRKQVDPAVFSEITNWKNQNISQSVVKGTMEALTSNERNALLDIMTTFDRKQFGIQV